jgi:hypothetical protein
MKKYNFLLLPLFFLFLLSGDKALGLAKSLCITIPKAGTHVMLKLLSHLGRDELRFCYNPDVYERPSLEEVKRLFPGEPPYHAKGRFFISKTCFLDDMVVEWLAIPDKKCLWSHFPYTPEFAKLLNSKELRNFLIIRDPRDQVVSMARMIYKYSENIEVPIETLLLDFIDGKQRRFVLWGVAINQCYPVEWELGVVDFYKQYLPFIKEKNFCVIRFEHLVGTLGGGSDELQKKEIEKIVEHLGLSLPHAQIAFAAKNLFGGTYTFREGKIGSWKEYFKPEVKKLFKSVVGANQLLIDLGYEKDDAW